MKILVAAMVMAALLLGGCAGENTGKIEDKYLEITGAESAAPAASLAPPAESLPPAAASTESPAPEPVEMVLPEGPYVAMERAELEGSWRHYADPER